jgi:hypothetical protein
MVRQFHYKILKSMGRFRILQLFIILVVFVVAPPHGAITTYQGKLARTVEVSIPVKRAVFLISYELIPIMGI